MPRLRRAIVPLLGVALLAGALPGLAPVVAGADPTPAPCASPSPSSSPSPSAAPEGSPGPSAVPSPSAAPAASASALPAPSQEVAGSVAVDPSPSPAASGLPAASSAPSVKPHACPPDLSALDLGRDGRLTVLLVGTDYRATVPGERTDVIIVMSIDPATRKVTAISVPRDTVFFPQAHSNGGGDSGTTRVNSLYELYRDPGLPHDKVDRKAMRAFERDIETALKVEIDYWGLTRFKGFSMLVKRVGGIRVQIPDPITDPTFHRSGAYFPTSDDYKLGVMKRCSLDKPCHNPLVYVRSRKGTVGDGFNSDFSRARRQQEVVMATASRLVNGGFTLDHLSHLMGGSIGLLWTDMPRTMDVALELLSLADGATMLPIDTAVFGPRKWAYEDAQTPVYTYRLRLDLVRAWMDDRFGTTPTH